MLEFWKFFLVFVGAGFSVFGVTTQPIHKTSFSCDGRTSGYYADVGSGCQVYHMCDGLGRQFSYKCPKNTLFQQRMLICDHWYMVNCSKSEEDYSANLLIGQQGKAFIEDLQFQRTPRPDLAGTDFNLYRTTQGAISTKNLVGAEESDSHFATEYFPPTHWSTEFSAPSTTPAPRKREESDTRVSGLTKQVFYSTNYRTGKRFLNKNGKDATNSINRLDNSEATRFNVKTNDQEKPLPSGVNFPSSFKATTPVYPKDLGIDISKFSDFANAPEESENNNNNKNPIVNFPSNYQGTTPVYPKEVNIDLSKFSGSEEIAPGQKKSADEVVVNFPSDFKATTPVYPDKVDADLSKFSGSDVVAPSGSSESANNNVVVNFASNFKATTPVYPKEVAVDISKFYGSEETAPGETGHYDDVVNFASSYKGTTPVYPLDAGIDSSKYSGIEELPPKQSDQEYKDDDVIVNFASNFKATTPVYPKEVNIDLSKFGEPEEAPAEKSNDRTKVDFVTNYTEATTPDYPPNDNAPGSILEDFGLLPPRQSSDSQSAANNDLFGLVPPRQTVDNAPIRFLPPRQDNVKQTANFGSNYQATTPVYPEIVEPSSPDPNDVGLLAPKSNIEYSLPSQDIQPPSFESTFKRRIDEEDLSLLGNTFSSQQLNRFMVTIRPEQLREIQELWRIPEYDFPLDSAASRPSYESHYSSFQANVKAAKTR